MMTECSVAPALDEGVAAGVDTDTVCFSDLGLPDRLLTALAADGYERPSPIQAAIIPSLLAGRDVIGQAQTGTGKTAAFALPILAQLAADAEAGHKHPRGPSALILTPTRELAIQVTAAFAKYGRKLGKVKVLAVYGGADMRGQSIALERGVDVVVGTPGRVMDHMRRGTLEVTNVRTLVLDEADEMLRMGFVEDVEWVLSETPAGRQVALFSATMPGAIRAIAERQLNNPERVVIEGESRTADTVNQRYWRVEGMTKFEALCRLLTVEPVDAALVFVRTREATGELARALSEAGYPAAPLSGEIAQSQRERTIEALRAGRLKLVVATDVAARGIDVKSITHVFNFDVPLDTEAYIHRIGRTGRAGRTGEAVLFVENRQRQLLKNIERATGQAIEKMVVPTEEEIRALQLSRFGEQLKERLAYKGETARPAALRGFIEEVCAATGRDAVDVAAFLVGYAMRGAGVGVQGEAAPAGDQGSGNGLIPDASPPEGAQRRRGERVERGERSERNERPELPGRAAGPRGMAGQVEVYRVAVGGAHGVQPGNLVGAIANEAGIEGRDIGAIRIFDSYSTVELPAGMPVHIFERLEQTTVMGRPLLIKRVEKRGWSKDGSAKRGGEGNERPMTEGDEPRKPKAKVKSKVKPKVKAKAKTKFNAKAKAGGKTGGKSGGKAGAKDGAKSGAKFAAKAAGATKPKRRSSANG